MDFYMVVLRVIHFFAGIFWFGAGLFNLFFLTPAVKATGPEGQSVMRTIMGNLKLPQYINLAMLLSFFSGLLLYWQVSGQANMDWIISNHGLILTIGSIAGIIAAVVAITIPIPAAKKIAAIAQQIQSSGKPPSAEQQKQISDLQNLMIFGAKIGISFLTISVLGMAAAQYVY